MNALNRALLAVVVGVTIAVILTEAVLALLALLSGGEALLPALAASRPLPGVTLILLGAIWLAAGAAGGAMAAGLSRHPLLALPVGLACAIPAAFTALVGLLPAPWVLAMGLSPLLGSLLGALAVARLQHLDQGEVPAMMSQRAARKNS